MPMSARVWQGLGAVAVAAAVSLSAVIVEETEFAVVTRFGRVTQVITEPGLYWKLPAPIDQALRLDKRILIAAVPESEFLTSDKKNVMVGMYVNWRIADPTKFLGAVRTRQAAESRLVALVQSALGSALGERPFTDFVPADGEGAGSDDRLGSLEATIRNRSAPTAEANLGIEVVYLGITRFNFPDQNLVAVFSRMRAERERIAKAYRSEGDAEAQKIVAEANRTAAETVATAEAEASRQRGAGEAEAARIYAEAYKGKEEFYEFLRTLEAYEQVINEQTTLVLPADAPILNLLLQSNRKP
ncbi:MAG: protease modulator HflC [Alphaproteobacteria bacterium]|nr:protease modulator HflC [Alphaproteobacteria bacterium]